MFKFSRKRLTGIILAICAALLYGIMPSLIRALDQDVPPVAQSVLRICFAAIFALIYIKATKKKIRIKKNDIGPLILFGFFGYAIQIPLLTYAIVNTEISNGIFIFSTHAIFVPFIAKIVLKEKITTKVAIAVCVSLIGLLLLYQPNSFSTWKIGGLLAFLAAMTQIVFVIGRKKYPQYSSETFYLINVITGLVVNWAIALGRESDFLIQNRGITNISSKTWILIAIFGLTNFLGWFLFGKALDYLKASTGSLLILLEPVFATTLGFIIFKESPSFVTQIGAILILVASMITIVKRIRISI